MDCAVIYSEAALADLQEITEFIAKDNAEVAARFANRLVDLAQSLRSLPERGRLTTDGESRDYCLVAILILTESVALLELPT
jgi:plasmid stabilization system protein ParE